jgi:hypothetical protein
MAGGRHPPFRAGRRGYEWLKTTTVYVNVHDDLIEQAWDEANKRVTDRFDLKEG